MSPDTRYYCRTYTGDEDEGVVTSTTSSTMDDGGYIFTVRCLGDPYDYKEREFFYEKLKRAELLAEKREGWLKPHKQLNPITYSVNGMIDRLINNRVREPG